MADESSIFQWAASIAGVAISSIIGWNFMRVWQRVDNNEKDVKDIREKYVRRDDMAEHIHRLEDQGRELKVSVDHLTRAVLKLVQPKNE